MVTPSKVDMMEHTIQRAEKEVHLWAWVAIGVTTGWAITATTSGWLIICLLRKVIILALGDFGSTIVTDNTNRYWDGVFLDFLSFDALLGLGFGFAVITGVLAGMSQYSGAKHAQKVSQSWRMKIVRVCAQGRALGKEKAGAAALDYVTRIEQFNKMWFVNTVSTYSMIVASMIFVFVFSWVAGLVTVSIIVIHVLLSEFFDNKWMFRMGDQFQEKIDAINEEILDVAKTGDVIALSNTSLQEFHRIQSMERGTDDVSRWMLRYHFYLRCRASTLFFFIVPIFIVVIYQRLQGLPLGEAMEETFGLLGAIVFLKDAQTSLVLLDMITIETERKNKLVAYLNSFTKIVEDDPIMEQHDRNSKESSPSVGMNCAILMEHSDPTFEKPEDVQPSLMTRVFSRKLAPQESISEELIMKLDGVTLVYPDSQSIIFQALNLDLIAHSNHGLVGESGSGKTSILKLFAGLLQPRTGDVIIDGKVLRKTDAVRTIRARMAVVSQDSMLFSRSLYENIVYGLEEDPSKEVVAKAIEDAQLKEWVETLPQGLDTTLHQGESQVSGGQLQRILLARLFLKRHVEFVLLDECTSALDAKTRSKVLPRLQAFLDPRRDGIDGAVPKTCLIVTHQPEVIQICDYIHEIVRVHENEHKMQIITCD